ncbi:DUF5777 family beta-barrel protein [Algivirga pacifica]|uniref:DUF5777 family beta-barrel protein n=2 Tax=Algivirga pacifica TaxID=1162670 RepID=A0ABP9D638_9BACT
MQVSLKTNKYKGILLPLLLGGFLIFSPQWLNAQDDLLEMLEDTPPTETYTVSTFKGTRVINSQSVDIQPAKELQFSISHRFGALNTGIQKFWGLDEAVIRLGFEYGITDRWAVGLGRSKYQATYDFYSKFKILEQTEGKDTFPLTMVLNSNMALRGSGFDQPEVDEVFVNRLFYTHQLLVARKFAWGSLQLMPTYTHNNIRELLVESNDMYAMGLAGRIKLTNRWSFLFDYYYLIDDELKTVFQEPLALSLELETGGHVFQFIFSNTNHMTEKLFLTRTQGQWLNGDIHFGFNISRTIPFHR